MTTPANTFKSGAAVWAPYGKTGWIRGVVDDHFPLNGSVIVLKPGGGLQHYQPHDLKHRNLYDHGEHDRPSPRTAKP